MASPLEVDGDFPSMLLSVELPPFVIELGEDP
jgi:hypothetical protein